MWPFKSKVAAIAAPAAPTPEMVEEATRNPNGWVYVIDGSFGPNAAIPPEAIVGAWKVDESGFLTGEYQANKNYRAKAI